jgi:hypothetical protein
MPSSGNICTLNPLTQPNSGTFSEGNLLFTHTTSDWRTTAGTHGMRTGKWYWEAYQYESLSGNGFPIGISDIDNGTFVATQASSYPDGSDARGGPAYSAYSNSGTYASRYNAGTETNMTLSIGVSGDVWQCALDLDNGKIWFGKNNTWDNSGNPATGSSPSYSGGQLSDSTTRTWVPITCSYNDSSSENFPQNFGQDSTFAGRITAGGNADENGFGDFKYAPPTGFLALCSGNLPVSDDIDPAQTDTDYPGKQFNTVLYTGNDGAQSVSNLGFKPDLVWIKARNSAQHHAMFDSSRGALKRIGSSRTNAEDTDSSFLSSFDTDGFSWSSGGDNTQNGSYNYVAWCWRANGGTTASNSNGQTTSTVQANQAAGFSIVEYAGSLTSSGTKTIGHGLSKAPEFIIKKQVNKSGRWYVWHTGMSGASYMLELNSNAAEVDKSGNGSMSLPTSTVFSTNYTEGSNENNYNNVTYCWHGVDGYSKFGKYTGNGNTNGIFVYTGFRPKLVYLKKSSGSGAWNIFYSPPKTFNSSANDYIVWSNSDSEANGVPVDFLSNGFKIRSSGAGVNGNGDNYVYGAWGDVPFKYNNTF